jgi:hypothetical protein
VWGILGIMMLIYRDYPNLSRAGDRSIVILIHHVSYQIYHPIAGEE